MRTIQALLAAVFLFPTAGFACDLFSTNLSSDTIELASAACRHGGTEDSPQCCAAVKSHAFRKPEPQDERQRVGYGLRLTEDACRMIPASPRTGNQFYRERCLEEAGLRISWKLDPGELSSFADSRSECEKRPTPGNQAACHSALYLGMGLRIAAGQAAFPSTAENLKDVGGMLGRAIGDLVAKFRGKVGDAKEAADRAASDTFERVTDHTADEFRGGLRHVEKGIERAGGAN